MEKGERKRLRADNQRYQELKESGEMEWESW